MPNGYETLRELGRAFDHFRTEEFAELREEVRFLRRLLIGTLTSAIVATFLGAALVTVRSGIA